MALLTRKNLPWIALGASIFVFYLGLVALGGWLVISAMKGEPYQQSLAAIQADERVLAALGEPLEPGLFVTGNVNISGPEGRAALEYSVTGPRGEATVVTYARKHAGRWRLVFLAVDMAANNERIILLDQRVPTDHFQPDLESETEQETWQHWDA